VTAGATEEHMDAYRALGFKPVEHEVSYVLDVSR